MFSPKNLILLLALLWVPFATQAQPCFIQEDDATGSTAFSTAQLAELEAAACSLRAVFPPEFQADFAVYDFGFYLHQESYVGGTPQVFQDKIAKIEQQTPYFLLFGRQLLRGGALGKVWVEVRLPEDNAYPCLEDRQWTISNLVNIAVEEILGGQALSSTSLVNASIAAISTLQTEVDHAVNCCDLQRSVVEGCPICPVEGQNYRELLRRSGYVQLSNVSNVRTEDIASVAEEVTQNVVVDVLAPDGFYVSSYNISQELIDAKSILGDAIHVSVQLYDMDSLEHCSQLAELVGNPMTPSSIINIGAGYDYYEEIIVLKEGESITLFSRVGGGGSNNLLDKIESNNRLPILPAIVLRIVLRRAVMAASNIAVNLVMEILMERGFGDHGPDCTWIETASYVNMSFWRLAAWGAEGAIGGNNMAIGAIFGALDEAIVYLFSEGGINNFDAEVFFGNIVQGAAVAVIGQRVAGFFLNNTTVGNFISQFQSNSIVDLQNELLPLAWDFILNPRMRRAWEELFDFPNLRTNTGALDALAKHRAGEAVPPPSTYLDTDYILNHLSQFNNEGSAFIAVKSWTEGGNPVYITLPERKFVGLRSEMDQIIASYRGNGNDWTVLRDELNLGSSTSLEGEEIYYIKIAPDDSRFSYEIPTGDEAGAIPGEWIPGGYTKNRTKESVLVGAENVVHNKSIIELLSNFDDWEQIQ